MPGGVAASEAQGGPDEGGIAGFSREEPARPPRRDAPLPPLRGEGGGGVRNREDRRVLPPPHRSGGRSPAGAIGPLRSDDQVITAYREHTQAIAKGISPRAAMAELFGRGGRMLGGTGRVDAPLRPLGGVLRRPRDRGRPDSARRRARVGDPLPGGATRSASASWATQPSTWAPSWESLNMSANLAAADHLRGREQRIRDGGRPSRASPSPRWRAAPAPTASRRIPWTARTSWSATAFFEALAGEVRGGDGPHFVNAVHLPLPGALDVGPGLGDLPLQEGGREPEEGAGPDLAAPRPHVRGRAS